MRHNMEEAEMEIEMKEMELSEKTGV